MMGCGLPLRAADVNFDFVSNTSLIVVPVTINGRGPYRFLLDTGASTTILSTAIADRLNLPNRRRATLRSAGGNEPSTERF
jgi:predicted aspartyl protease